MPMNELFLSEAMVARSFWTELRSNTRTQEAVRDVETVVFPHSLHVAQAFPVQTGSISRASAEVIWLLARYFAPKSIAEVGTFIGRSTLSLYLGAQPSLEFLATCDHTFDTWRAPPGDAGLKIRYFGKTGSHQMFQRLADENRKIEMFLIDGRIAKEELDLIDALSTPQTVFIIDDFEGVEKGVANAMMLRERIPNSLLLTSDAGLETGWNDSHCLAVLVPAGNIRLTRQQRLPLTLM
jgi:predicted O-methyltransferase YrrM